MLVADGSHVVNLTAHLSERDLLSLSDHRLIRHCDLILLGRCVALLTHLSGLRLQDIEEVPDRVACDVCWQVGNQSADSFLHESKHIRCHRSLDLLGRRSLSIQDLTVKLLEARQKMLLDLVVYL